MQVRKDMGAGVRLTAMRGYSGSGKSTRAREIANETDAVVVNRDLLRLQLLGSWWTGRPEDEDRVTVAEEAQVDAFLRAGTSVVVDNTHLHAAYLRRWQRLAAKRGADFEVVDVHADIAECKRRVFERWQASLDSVTERYLDPKIVDQQVRRFPVEKWPTITAEAPLVVEPVEWVQGLPEAYIFDIDGTLALHQGRSPFDYTRVSEDAVNDSVRRVLNAVRDSRGYPLVFIVSGRDDTCRHDTVAWLTRNEIFFDELHMRDTTWDVDSRGNKLADVHVKYRIFNEQFRGKVNVIAVFDDRQQVVDLWRAMGLTCMQVAEGDF